MNQDFIDFVDIINDKKRDNVEMVETKLEELSNYINSLHECGIPKETIKNTLNNLLFNDLNSKKEPVKVKNLKQK